MLVRSCPLLKFLTFAAKSSTASGGARQAPWVAGLCLGTAPPAVVDTQAFWRAAQVYFVLDARAERFYYLKVTKVFATRLSSRPKLYLLAAILAAPILVRAQTDYDLLLKGGHVIDGKNHLSAVRDVAIKDGKIAAVEPSIAASRALKTVNAAGLYVTPGLVDIHVHVYPGNTKNSYANGDWGLPPDGFTLRAGVTTVADAGSSGWRTFPDFKDRIIDQSKTRVLAFINIVGAGMGSGPIEQNLADMEVKPTAEVALKYKGLIVGIKSAHFAGPEWAPYERAVEVGNIAHIPVMIDFGSNVRAGRSLYDLLNKY